VKIKLLIILVRVKEGDYFISMEKTGLSRYYILKQGGKFIRIK